MTDTNDDPSVNLIRAIVQNVSGPVVDWDNWESMSILVESFQNRYNSVSGSLYSPDGTISIVAARPSAVIPFVDAYVNSVYKPGEKLPVSLFVQFSRKSGKYTITFEDTDRARWKVTPKNYKEIREQLRPTLDD